MEIVNDMRQQTCVYWRTTGRDSGGNLTYDTPRELRVRWLDTNEVFIDRNGAQKVSKSKVFVGEDLKPDDVLRYGLLTEVTKPTKPLLNPGASIIQAFSKIPVTIDEPPVEDDDFVRIAFL